MIGPIRLLAIVAALGVGCARSPSAPEPVPLGRWGGDHIAMTVGAGATHVELDCAHGDVSEAITTDTGGRFSVAGVFVRERGGPIRSDDPQDRRPATYAGTVRSNRMSLTIRLSDTGELIGSFNLELGVQGRIVKCL